MKRRWTILLGVLLAVILGIIFWILEYQHVSLLLWMLVLFAALWYCATFAVSLRPLAARRKQTSTRVSSRSSFITSRWKMSLVIAVIIGVVGIIMWKLGLETLSHISWFLVVVALLWGCAQLSILLRPTSRRRVYEGGSDSNWIIRRNWVPKRTFFDQFLPGVTMKSGVYNEGDENIWDGNQKLPPQNN